jgi:hypothetical protein
MSKEQFKMFEKSKEQYMEAALLLKEELEGKAGDEANDDEDDDDEDRDVEANTQGEKPDEELSLSEPNGDSNAEVVATSNHEKQGNGVSEPANGKQDSNAAQSPVGPINTANNEVDGHKELDKGPEADTSSCNPSDSSDILENINTTGHPTVSDKDAHLPTEPAQGFPDGWVIRRITRKNISDKRTDRNWYSPKLGLRFRAKADAVRFLEKLENAKGDEVAAITDFHEEKKPTKVANKAANRNTANKASIGDGEIGGSKTEYDFCDDIPDGPDLIRRCVAVLRTLCASSSSDQFIYPVDPQLYPG